MVSSIVKDSPSSSGSANRRQTEFHQTFRSISDEEHLIESYACALHREILLQGRLYLGEEHLCFYANILGWITSVVIALRDVVSIEKRNTALIFPNAIQVATLQHRYFFASFVYRDDAFIQLQRAWRRALLEKAVSSSLSSLQGRESRDLFHADQSISEDSRRTAFRDDLKEEGCMGPATVGCGCDYHHEEVVLNSLLLPLPLTTVRSLLYDEHSPFLREFFNRIGDLQNYQASTWGAGPAGGEQRRTIMMDMSFPLLLLKRKDNYALDETSGAAKNTTQSKEDKNDTKIDDDTNDNNNNDVGSSKIGVGGEEKRNWAKLRGIERVLNFLPMFRHVAETEWNIEGLTGGTARVIVRCCLVANNRNGSEIKSKPSTTSNTVKTRRESTGLLIIPSSSIDSTLADSTSTLTVTLSAFAPPGSFFRESIKRALMTRFFELYASLGAALLHQPSVGEADEEHLKTLNSAKFRRRRGPSSRRAWLMVCIIFMLPSLFLLFNIIKRSKNKRMAFESRNAERLEKLQSLEAQLQSIILTE